MKHAGILWFLGALAAGLAAVVIASFVQHRPPPALLGALESTPWGGDLAQSWIRATAVRPRDRVDGLRRGDPAPDLTLPDMHGRPHHLSEWRGRRVLLNFWASWCQPCRREMPALNAAQARYGSGGTQIIGIALDDPGRVRAFLENVHISYPVLLGSQATPNPAEIFGDSLDVLPFSVLIDKHGRIKATYYGPLQPSQLHWWLD